MRSSKKKGRLTPWFLPKRIGQDRENERRPELRVGGGIPLRMLSFELLVRDLGECRL